MLSHSVNVVSAPKTNIKTVKLNRQKKMEEAAEVSITPVDISPIELKIKITALKTIVMMVRSIAGQIVINMS